MKWPTPKPDAETKARTQECFLWLTRDYYMREKEQKQKLIALIEQGICVEAQNNEGRTLLHRVARNEGRELIKILLAQGAKVNAKDNENLTPLLIAADCGNMAALKTLLENGANIEAITTMEQTSLHLAAQGGYTRIVKALVASGADLEAKNDIGQTPLTLAAEKGNIDVLKILLMQGAQVDTKACHGHTPLHMGANKKEAAEALVMKGANIYAQTIQGYTLDDYTHHDFNTGTNKQLYIAFAEEREPPLSAEEVYQILSVWPLSDPKAPIDRVSHLRQIFSYACWESPEQAADVIGQLQEQGENPSLCDSLRAMTQAQSHVSRIAQAGEGRWI